MRIDLPQTVMDRYVFVPYFDERPMPSPSDEYVLWLDLMGMQNAMQRSVKRTANFVMKLLAAVVAAKSDRDAVHVCPVIDGAFIHGADRQQFLGAVRDIYARLAMSCVAAYEPEHRFLVRGAIAYGPLVQGRDITSESCFRPSTYRGEQASRPNEADAVIFGPSVSWAYAAAMKAPPFGVRVHESARQTSEQASGIYGYPLWHWWLPDEGETDLTLASYLKDCLEKHFEWCEARPIETGYETQRLKEHRTLFREYYIDVQRGNCSELVAEDAQD